MSATASDRSAGEPRYLDGLRRICAPAQTLTRLRPLMATFGITRVANVTGLDRTGVPVVMVCRPSSRSIAVSQGKGMTLEAAKVSGLMEAIEVWHAERIMRPLLLGSLPEIRQERRVVDVLRLPRSAKFAAVTELQTLWIEGRDLNADAGVWIPYELVSTNYTLPFPPGSGMFQANTNGLASGNDIVEAQCHAICEVVERDATTRWKLLTTAARDACSVDLDSIDDPDCRMVIGRLRDAALSVHVWEMPTDVRVASFVCLVMEEGSDFADPEFGAGCHPLRAVALLRALLEGAQARNTYICAARDDFALDAWEPSHRRRRQRDCRALLPRCKPRRRFDEAPNFVASGPGEDRDWILACLRAAGFDQVISVDLSKEGIGIAVVKVVVPGLEGPISEDKGDYVPGARARRWAGWSE
jgi:ribosomal protein S12 methylthiotransferase accessory factor